VEFAENAFSRDVEVLIGDLGGALHQGRKPCLNLAFRKDVDGLL